MIRRDNPLSDAGAWRALAVALAVLLASGCTALGIPGASPAPVHDAKPAAEEAEDAGEQAATTPPIALDADIVFDYLLADVAERRGDIATSVDAMVRLAQRTRSRDMIVRAFRNAVRANHVDQALGMADLLEEIGDNPIHVGFARAQAHLAGGQLDDVMSEIRDMLEAFPEERERIFNNAGEIFAQQREPGAFVAGMERLADTYPDDPHGYFALSYLANRARDTETLDRAIKRVLEISPDWEQAALVRYVALVQANRVEEADQFAEAFISNHPDALDLEERHARLLVARGEIKPALAHFERILHKDANNSDVLLAVALIRMQLEEWKAARRALLHHLKLNPQSDETRMHLGRVAMARERYDEAIDWYSQVRDETLLFAAQLRIATALQETEGNEAALEHLYGLVPVTREEEVELLLAQEQILRDMDRLAEAHRLLDGAVREIPDNGDLLYARGLLAAELHLLDEHEQDLRRVIELEPDNAHAYNALGYTLADQTDRYDEALKLITRALDLAPNDPFIIDSMGWVQYRLGNYDTAIEYLRRALSIRNDAEIGAHLGEVLWVAGTRDEARRVWDAALKVDPQNQTLLETLKRFAPQ